ncbi:hypothetical protein HZ326_21049 [Fusarium oxysporum f. sp. albedinis]|nr:hypothetical protein HZ326_21049 [Fusarium oxysporum f. sp. albedinis]
MNPVPGTDQASDRYAVSIASYLGTIDGELIDETWSAPHTTPDELSRTSTSDHLPTGKKRHDKKLKTGCNNCKKHQVQPCFPLPPLFTRIP